MRRIISLIILGSFVAFGVSIIADRLVGWYVSGRGYFYAVMPRVTEMYNTEEFSVIATTSAQGIRNPIVDTKDPNVYRILALGDSLTYGWGVDEAQSWPRVLESTLHGSGKNAQVINAGAIGSTFMQYARICEAYTTQFDPDMIIVGVYFWDDFYQSAELEQKASPLRRFVHSFWYTFPNITQRVIASLWQGTTKPGSRVDAVSFWRNIARSAIIQDPAVVQGLDPLVRPVYLAGRINPVFVGRLTDRDYLTKFIGSDARGYALRASESWIRRLKECAGSRPIYSVGIPSADLVSAGYFPYRTGLGFDVDNRLVTTDWDSELSKYFHRLGITYIPLLSILRGETCENCYYHWDIHLNPVGQAAVGRAVKQAIDKSVP